MGVENGVSPSSSEKARRLKTAKSRRNDPGTPLGILMDEFADARGMDSQDLSIRLGQGRNFIRNFRAEVRIPIERMARLLTLFEHFGLNSSEKTRLADATEATILKTLSTYGYIPEIAPVRVKAEQLSQNGCRTYTGAQAAELIGVSRTTVKEWRRKLKLPPVMTQEMVVQIAGNVKKAPVNKDLFTS